MRTITDHIVEGDSANHQLTISVLDEPGQGGANHQYQIDVDKGLSGDGERSLRPCLVAFQNGPIKEFGVNGVTQEALLAIVIDRLRSFQAGPFASPFNASALRHCEQALGDLQQRTRNRIARGVEGTHSA
jgi:hypothetical protein